MTLRSASVRYANVTITRLITTNASMRLTHQSTGWRHAFDDLDGGMQLSGVLVGDAGDARRSASG